MMITGLKPYPSYKESGEPWLGMVPEHWELRSLGSLITTVSKRGRPDLPLLSVVREKGVIPRSTMSEEENRNFVPDDLSNYKMVQEGNLVINKMKAWQGSLGIAPIDGIVSPAYYVFDFKINNRQFGQALLRSKTYVAFFARASDGVRIGQWDLSVDGMKRIPVVIPPPSEQTAIVRFLDYMDRRIRRYIRAKQKLIKLLEEQKQVIIHRAVTRGLDPKVRLKPSCVEWLGDVPENWDLKMIRHAIYLQRGYDLSADKFISGSYPVYGSNGIIGHHNEYTTTGPSITIGRSGSVGEVHYIKDNFWAHNTALYAKRFNNVIVLYAFYLFKTINIESLFSGSAVGTLNRNYIHSIRFAFPPIKEQSLIAEYLNNATLRLNTTIQQIQTEIKIFHELRVRLINDVVTGKLDVRQITAQLPDEVEDLGELNEVEITGDNEIQEYSEDSIAEAEV